MKIRKLNPTNCKPIESVSYGECFLFEDKDLLYMRISVGMPEKDILSVVELASGELEELNAGTIVQVVDATVEYKELA